jgi:spermidine synthase
MPSTPPTRSTPSVHSSSWVTLDRARTSDGSELALCRRGERFALRIDGQELMHSNSHGSEERLAVHGCAALVDKPGARVLVGGLGMGFTARAALDVLPPDAEVVVVEAVAAVIAWNRDRALLGQLARMPLEDPRLSIVEGDVADAIERANAQYDAILLDVDNGPMALTTFRNRRLYAPLGLESARRALRGEGVLAVWSTFQDARFTARLREVGFDARTKRVLAGDGTSRRHVLWLARPASAGHGLGLPISSRKRYRTPATTV